VGDRLWSLARGSRSRRRSSADRTCRRTAWVNALESGKPAAELRLVLAVVDALGLELQLGDREHSPQHGATVDLDQLLDEYGRP
jgi:hypothetical protein